MTARSALALALVLAACDRGRGETNTPTPPQSSQAPRTQPRQQPASDPRTSDLYDWSATDRAELQNELAGRLYIFIAMDGTRARPRFTCHGRDEYRAANPVSYGFASHRPREEHSVVDGTTIDATFVGTWTVAPIPRDTRGLEGDCAGVTHVVRAIDVGAFEASSRSSTAVRGEVPQGGAVVGGSSSSTSSQSRKSGDRSTCVASATPQQRCNAAIRLHLAPLAR